MFFEGSSLETAIYIPFATSKRWVLDPSLILLGSRRSSNVGRDLLNSQAFPAVRLAGTNSLAVFGNGKWMGLRQGTMVKTGNHFVDTTKYGW